MSMDANDWVLLPRSALARSEERMQDLRDTIAGLKEAIEILINTNGYDVPEVWGFARIEKRLFRMLKPNKITRKEYIYHGLYADRYGDGGPVDKIIDVYICKIRKKLKKHNAPWHIETAFGEGYILREGPENDA